MVIYTPIHWIGCRLSICDDATTLLIHWYQVERVCVAESERGCSMNTVCVWLRTYTNWCSNDSSFDEYAISLFQTSNIHLDQGIIYLVYIQSTNFN